MVEQKITTWIAFLIIILIIVPAALICYSRWKSTIKDIEEMNKVEYNIQRK